MLRILIILLLIYFFFRFGKILLTWYLRNKIDSVNRNRPRVDEKFKDASEADFTDIIDPDKKKNKE